MVHTGGEACADIVFLIIMEGDSIMKSRQEIKAIAKQAMAQQRGTCIGIQLLVGLAVGAASFLAYIPVLGVFLSLAVSFVSMVLSVNVAGIFVRIYYGETVSVGDPFSNIPVNFWPKVGGMWWMSLWIFLWAMLLYVPGIIKSYAYSMTPYILENHPNVKARDALKLSMRMTDGYKGELFVLSLSWIGWMFLGFFTFGILYLVHVGPYIAATNAGYFVELRDRAIAAGVIHPDELGMSSNSPNAGYNPNAGYPPNAGYIPNAGYNPNTGYPPSPG